VELTVRVDLPVSPAETPTVAWLRTVVRPDGDTATVREMTPENSSTLLNVMSSESEEP
jgi:hypothetical protein